MTTKGTKKAFLRVPAHIGEKARLQAERTFVDDESTQAGTVERNKETDNPKLDDALSTTSHFEQRRELGGSVKRTSIEGGLVEAQSSVEVSSVSSTFSTVDQRIPKADLSAQGPRPTDPAEEASLTGNRRDTEEDVVSGAEVTKHASKLPYAHRRVWADSVLRIEQAFYELAADQAQKGARGPCRWRRNQLARVAGLRSAQTVDEAIRVLIGLGLVRRRSLRGPQGAEFELQQGSVAPDALAQRMAAGLRLLAARIERLEPEAWRERAVVQVIERVASTLAVFEETPQLME